MITTQIINYFHARPTPMSFAMSCMPKLKEGQWINRSDNAAARGGCRHRTLYWSVAEQAPPTYHKGKYNGRVRQRKLALALVDSGGGLASQYKSDSWAEDEKRIRF
jgi:hypothetical protein